MLGGMSIFEHPISTLRGDGAALSGHEGEALLLVNVASRCGLTPQYTGLEQLQQTYGERGFSVVGFPCNQFGGQEPGTAEEIAAFCKTKYDVSFPLFEKGVTKAGPTQSPIYQYLGATGNLPGWNFSKYVIDKKGQVVAFFPSKVTPDAPELKAAIDKALAE
jgi:glutathione peroxidase